MILCYYTRRGESGDIISVRAVQLETAWYSETYNVMIIRRYMGTYEIVPIFFIPARRHPREYDDDNNNNYYYHTDCIMGTPPGVGRESNNADRRRRPMICNLCFFEIIFAGTRADTVFLPRYPIFRESSDTRYSKSVEIRNREPLLKLTDARSMKNTDF